MGEVALRRFGLGRWAKLATWVGLWGLLASPVQAATFTGVYVFGDSLVDVGNLLVAVPDYPHPSPPYDGGRFSNGPLYVEGVAAHYGYTLTPSLLGGTNYAFAGARTTGGVVPSLIQQAQGYVGQAGSADPGALYIINAGGNDVRDAVGVDPTVAQGVAANIRQVLNGLYAAGARRFLVANAPDIGLMPEFNSTPEKAAKTSLSVLLDQYLNAELADFRTVTGVKAALLDVLAFGNEGVNDPGDFGFTNVTDACFNETTGSLCTDPDQHLFFDSIHPTRIGHQILAQDAIAVTPLPATLPLLAAPVGFLMFRVWRRRRSVGALSSPAEGLAAA